MSEKRKYFLAIDLGASNGSVMVGILDGDRLIQQEAHRFRHRIVQRNGMKCWDWDFLEDEIRKGLGKACQITGNEAIESVCCSSWSLDFGLLDRQGELLYKPVSYRDKRTNGLPYDFSKTIDPQILFKKNGSTITPVTTLCQLYSMVQNEPEPVNEAEKLLFIADLVNYRLCGKAVTDWTFATASQMINIESREWDSELLDKLGIPRKILPEFNIIPKVIGKINCPDIDPKLNGVPVVSGAGHDTAIASSIVFIGKERTAFISLGTWAMIGCYDEGIDFNGIEDFSISVLGLPWGKWGLFCSSVGLWLIQECVRNWEEIGIQISHKELAQKVANSNIDSIISVNDERFFSPENMTEEIVNYCKETNQIIPEKPEDFAKVIFDSLANEFGNLIERLQNAGKMRFEKIHIVSGGSRNGYLCSKISEFVGIPVIAGPAEATSIGNIILQARVMNILKDEEQINDVIKKSFPVITAYGL